MLPRSERLKTAAFARAFNHSRVLRHPLLQLRVHVREVITAAPRAAFVVPRKVGKATLRNQIRRRTRERYRLNPLRHQDTLSRYDLIFMANDNTLTADNEQLDAAITQLLRRAASTRTEAHPAPVKTTGATEH